MPAQTAPPKRRRPTAPAGGDSRLRVDRPTLYNGTAIEPIRGTLVIEGWALARGGVEAIDIAVDGKHLASAHYGARRPDIADSFPDWEGAGASGYTAMLPATALANGRRRVSIELRAKNGATTATEFSIDVEQTPAEEGPSVLRSKMPLSEVQLGMSILSGLGWRPSFGLLLGIGEGDWEIEAARRTLARTRTH